MIGSLRGKLLEKRPPVLEPTQKALDTVASLSDQLVTKSLTRTEALKDLANVAEKLKEDLPGLRGIRPG